MRNGRRAFERRPRMTLQRTPTAGTPSSDYREIRRSEADDAVFSLVERAQRSIALYAPRLDLPFFNRARTAQSLARFVAAGRQNRIRILVGDEQWFIRHNPRLVSLARRYSSFVEVRRTAEDVTPASECFVVVDASALFHQPTLGEPTCLVGDNARAAGAVLRRFDEEWKACEPLAEISVLGL